jgi:ferredoxin
MLQKFVGPTLLSLNTLQLAKKNDISSICQSFTFKEKQFILRGAILGDGLAHFTACMKAGTHWLYYDGLKKDKSHPGVFFELIPINRGVEAMHGYGLTYVFYEVLDLDDQVENLVVLTGLDVIIPETGEENKVKREVKAAEIEIGLKEILSLTKKKVSKKKMAQEAPKTKANPRAGQRAAASPRATSTKSSQRIPLGFSFKRGSEQSSKGPLPTCRGCKMPIASCESKVIHKHKDAGHKYHEIHQYHCNAGCVADIGQRKLVEFVEKKWSEKEVNEVIEKLQKTEYYLPSGLKKK